VFRLAFPLQQKTRAPILFRGLRLLEATDVVEVRAAPNVTVRSRRAAVLTRAWRALPYVLIAVIPALVLSPWFGVPIEKDEGAYITIGMGIRHGLIPYKDLFDNKTPLIYVVYFFSYVVGGGIYTPRLLAAGSLGLTGLCVAGIGREFGWARGQYIAGGVVFALSTSNVLLEANANTEAFMVLPLTASLLALLIARRDSASGAGSFRWCIIAGVLGALAILFKTAAAPPVGMIFLYLCVQERNRRSLSIAYAAGVAAPLVLCVGVFAVMGALPAFVYSNYTFNRMFFGGVPFFSDPATLWSMPTRVLFGGISFWFLAALGCVAAILQRGRTELLLMLWGAACYIGVKATGLEHSHYYVELLPAAALFAVVLIRWVPPTRAARLAGVALLTIVAVVQADVYTSLVLPGPKHDSYTGIINCEEHSEALANWARAHSD
jgi:hypothetical protein